VAQLERVVVGGRKKKDDDKGASIDEEKKKGETAGEKGKSESSDIRAHWLKSR